MQALLTHEQDAPWLKASRYHTDSLYIQARRRELKVTLSLLRPKRSIMHLTHFLLLFWRFACQDAVLFNHLQARRCLLARRNFVEAADGRQAVRALLLRATQVHRFCTLICPLCRPANQKASHAVHVTFFSGASQLGLPFRAPARPIPILSLLRSCRWTASQEASRAPFHTTHLAEW